VSSELTPIKGRIIAIAGTNPGPASGITYTIGVIWRGGAFTVDGQRPSSVRWPDSIGGEPAHVRAYPVGALVPGDYDVDKSEVYWWFSEWPDAGTCSQAIGGGNQLPPGVVPPPPPPPPAPFIPSGSVSAVASASTGVGPSAE
jgi:hypothetical protein